MSKFKIEERFEWRKWVTPKSLAGSPIHNWLIFPHSFTSELVHTLIEEWELGPNDFLLDPFVGAGTTLLASKEKRIPAQGYDISPFATLITRVKIANYNVDRLEKAWSKFDEVLGEGQYNGTTREYPDLLRRALPGKLLSAFDKSVNIINDLSCSRSEKDFFKLALLSIVPNFSRAKATGGWLKWVEKRNGVRSFSKVITRKVKRMLQDLSNLHELRNSVWQVNQADARQLPDPSATYTALITSPPYPNRHDYTRIFGIEIMLGFLNFEETRKLRYQSFHSHPEAKPKRPEATEYAIPHKLRKCLNDIKKYRNDPRVLNMLEGYFLDIYLCLKEAKRVCKSGAKIAYVVGNAQYYGRTIPVDELTAEIGEQAGLDCQKLIVVRYRGNSSQQMGFYGRKPSRESVVIFKKP